MQEQKRLTPVCRFGSSLAVFLYALFALVACSDGGDLANIERNKASGDSPAIDDILPLPYREIWAPWTGDLDGMTERRMIRVVAPYGGYMYYFDDGEPRGAAWELTKRFESYVNDELGHRNVRVLVVVIPLSRDQLIPALLEGHADLIAADLTTTEIRRENLGFTRALLEGINEVVVTGSLTDEIKTLDDLAGREIHVRASSSYYEHLIEFAEMMRNKGLEPPDIVEVDELLESEDLLDLANSGMIDMTVLDDYKAEFWAGVFPNIEVREDLVIHEGGTIAWAVRKDSPDFLAKLNAFLGDYGRGTLVGNDIYNRYLDDAGDLRCSSGVASGARLEELAVIFQEFGGMYELDWLKLAAQGFQESKLQQDRRSNSGAIGIMQIKPSTASDPNVGIDDISDADGNIHAGTKYMRFLIDRYFSDENINELNSWLLGLAAYNAGPSRVINLRNEAQRNGYDPDVWFDNVEIIAAKRIGSETVTYVSNIFKYYTAYQMAFAKLNESEKRFGSVVGSCPE
jgi:membrane-bound lytic murein transglycosylase MltF